LGEVLLFEEPERCIQGCRASAADGDERKRILESFRKTLSGYKLLEKFTY
jgi:hypothetical protein